MVYHPTRNTGRYPWASSSGKIAIVTGATSGIGRRTVEIFVAEGAKVLATGRRAELGQSLEASLGKENCLFFKADATDEADVKAMFDACLSTWGRLDCLFNNAGGPAPVGGIETIPVEGFDAAMATLVRSVMLGMKHAAPIMMKQGSRQHHQQRQHRRPPAGYSTSMIYGAAKAAVNHLTVCAAMQLGEKNVRCNSISPGGIATGIFAKALGVEHGKADSYAEAAAKTMAALQPIPRAGRTDDIAKAAVFLASDEFDLHQRPRPGGRWRRGRRPAMDAAPASRAGHAPRPSVQARDDHPLPSPPPAEEGT